MKRPWGAPVILLTRVREVVQLRPTAQFGSGGVLGSGHNGKEADHMQRSEKVLSRIDPHGIGLEIGPSYGPIAPSGQAIE